MIVVVKVIVIVLIVVVVVVVIVIVMIVIVVIVVLRHIPIDVTPSGMVTDVREEQPAKAPLPYESRYVLE